MVKLQYSKDVYILVFIEIRTIIAIIGDMIIIKLRTEKMRKTILNFSILTVIIMIVGYFLIKSVTDIDIPIVKDIKIVTKREIKIKGTVIVKEKIVPYVISLQEFTPNEYKFDFYKSKLPDGMTVGSVETISKYDYLAPIRLGYGIMSTGEYRPTIAYNPIAYKSLEIGIITAFDSVGVDIGIRYRNVGLNAFYQASNVCGIGVMVKVF